MAEESAVSPSAEEEWENEAPPSVPVPRKTGSFRPDEIRDIPITPGVYIMFDAHGKVIYVGKAINLRARVRQYFAEGGDDRVSVPLIRRALDHIETIVTNTEKEAFLLENTLIKRHRPRYNVRLRDDKTYVSVRIDMSEEWPRPEIRHVRRRDNALFFGPYTSSQAIRETLRSLQFIFPLRGCSERTFANRTRPCLLYQIGLCNGVCAGKVGREEYDENLRGTIEFLRGHTDEVISVVRKRMQEYSEKMEYEKASKARDQIRALEESAEKQRVTSQDNGNRDVIGYHEDQGQAGIVILFYRNGQLVESSKWVVPTYGEHPAKVLSQFLGQYYREGKFIPPEVLIPMVSEDKTLIEEWLGDLRGGRVHLIVPQRGEKLSTVKIAESNAREVLARKLSGKAEAEEILGDLADRLHLNSPPRTIECYDIATLQGSMSAGAQVSFVDGEPNKGGYRLYKIKGVEGVDDFAMMREVLTRRFRRALESNEDLPDLVVIDGGKGQLSVAEDVLQELGITSVPLAALVKSHLKEIRPSRKEIAEGESIGEGLKEAVTELKEGETSDRKEEAGATMGIEGSKEENDKESGKREKIRTPEHLFVPGRKNPVIFPPHAPSFYLLQRLRDEAHRFVNTYHVKRRGKANLRSSLEDIPGIGKRRAQALLRHFGSLARVRGATVEQLTAAPRMNAAAGQKVFDFLHPEEKKID